MTGWVARRDLLGGLLMLVLGLATAWQATHYNLGALRRMGPGFFPLSLGVILAITGLLIMLTAKTPADTAAPAPAEWRGWFCICTGIAAFVVLGQFFGLIPATLAVVFIAALGDRENTLLGSAVLAVAMTAVCVLVFSWLLQVPFPLLHWN